MSTMQAIEIYQRGSLQQCRNFTFINLYSDCGQVVIMGEVKLFLHPFREQCVLREQNENRIGIVERIIDGCSPIRARFDL